MSSKAKMRAAVISNILTFVLVLGAWALMASRGKNTALAAAELSSLKYFTVLSNIFNGAVCAAEACQQAAVLRGRRKEVSRGVFVLRYVALSSVAVTFLVVLLFLGPAAGLFRLYRGANLWFHLIIPVLTIAEFELLEQYHSVRFKESFFCMVPELLYGTVYLINILVNGAGKWPDPNDIYGFAQWGIPAGIGIFAFIVMMGWGCGLLLRLRVKYLKKEAE